MKIDQMFLIYDVRVLHHYNNVLEQLHLPPSLPLSGLSSNCYGVVDSGMGMGFP